MARGARGGATLGAKQSIQFLHFPTSDAITTQYCGAVAAADRSPAEI